MRRAAVVAGRCRSIANGHCGTLHMSCCVSICRVCLQASPWTAEDIAVGDAVTVLIAVGTDTTATDGNGSIAVYRTHRTRTIDTANDMTAIDGYRGVALYTTAHRIVMVITVGECCPVRVLLVGIRTATGTIDAAAVRPCVVIGVSHADGAAVDIDLSITRVMAVLTTAIDGTLDLWLRSIEALFCSTDGHYGVFHPCQMVVDVAGSISGLIRADVTARRTVDHTVVVTVDTDGTTSDSHRGRTCFTFPVDGYVGIHDTIRCLILFC